ncbi:MAG: anaerobic ribonucleoside-triphosphate reductase activating protein [archaeon]
MNIAGFVDSSTLDWDGKISAVVFTPGCNFRCPFCHNRPLVLEADTQQLIPEEKILNFAGRQKKFLDAVCITGGEPTLQPGLSDFCRKIRAMDLLVKVDTNGSNPEVIKQLIKAKAVDYFAMDINAQLEQAKYDRASGAKVDLEKIKESIQILKDSGIDYELRTTVVPGLHTEKDIEAIAKGIKGVKKYVLQKFVPGRCLNSKYDALKSQSDEEMSKFVAAAKKHIDNVKHR